MSNILGSILGSVLGGGQQQGGVNPLLQAVLGMLAGGGQPSGQGGMGGLGGVLGQLAGGGQSAGGPLGGLGGIGGLIDLFRGAGMGNAMDSWIGTGENLPISAEQLQQVLGSDRIGGIAQQLGMSQQDTAGQLSQMLPEIINQLTPRGQVPEGGFGDIGSMLSTLSGALRG